MDSSERPAEESQFDQGDSQVPHSHTNGDFEDEFSDATDGVRHTEQDALQEEESLGEDGGFQLEADSEEEGDVTPNEGDDDYGDAAPTSYDENGNRRELITDTGESYSQDYEQDDEYGGEASRQQNLYSEQFERTGQSAINQAIRPNATSSGAMISQSYLTSKSQSKTHKSSIMAGVMQIGLDMAAEEALDKLKRQIDAKQRKKEVVEADEAFQSLRNFANEKVPINNERMDMFFKNNQFLKEFRDQTDILAVHELYKVLTLRSYTAGQTVFRYGTTSDECFFVIKGSLRKLKPEQMTFAVKYEDDLIQFYADNFDNVIWEKVEDADELKHIVQLYRENPANLNLDRPKKAKMIQQLQTLPVSVPLEFEDTVHEIQEQLSRPGSAYSRASRVSKYTSTKSDFSKPTSQNDSGKMQSNPRLVGSNINVRNERGSSRLDFHKARHSNPVASQAGLPDRKSRCKNKQSSDARSEETFYEDLWLNRPIGEVGTAECFGQAALAQTKPHLLTYECVEDCEIACLNRESYIRIVEKAVKRDLLGRVQFLKSFKVLSEMSQNQLENLLFHLKLVRFNRGQTIFKAGEKPDGVYLIQEGSFELSKPGNLHENQEKIVDQMKVDPMAKFQLRKQAKVIKDNSRRTVKLAILGTGELFGLEECQIRPSQCKPKPRSYTVSCLENNSKVIYMSHQVLADKVLNDPRLEQQIKYDCALKEFFHNSRELQHQQTIWNGALTSMRQIENATEKAEDDFDSARKKDSFGQMDSDLKGMPQLRTVDQYLKEKFEAEILNTIMDKMQERAVDSLAQEDEGVREVVKKKMKEIESHFDHNINVINADRKEQKARKEHQIALKELEKSRREDKAGLSLIASRDHTIDSNTQFQDSLISSKHMQLSPAEQEYSQNFTPPHFASTDDKMKLMQKMVNQQRAQDFIEEMYQQAPHFVSAEHEMTQLGVQKKQQAIPMVDESSEKSASKLESSRKEFTSQFGLKSNTEETVNALAAAANQDVRSIAIDEGPQSGTVTPKGLLPPISGDRSDGAVFRGLNNSAEGSGALLGSHSQLEKIAEQSCKQGQDTGEAPALKLVPEQVVAEQKAQMNKTQDTFHKKEHNKLLDMFKEQNSDKEDSPKELSQSAKPEEAVTPAAVALDTPAEAVTPEVAATAASGEYEPAVAEEAENNGRSTKEGGIIVSHRSRPDLKASNLDKRHSNATKSSLPKNEMAPAKELSDTTRHPSQMGIAMSVIRDPRYNQDMVKKQPNLIIGKKRLGLSSQIAVPGGPNKPVKIPKVALEADNMPVYQEGEERDNPAEDPFKSPPSPPVVNISTRFASKDQSKELLENDTIASPKTEASEQNIKHEQSTEEKPSIYKTSNPLVSNELPYNQHISQSGLKGKKRNQLSYISKTINDKSLKSKLRPINSKDLMPSPILPDQAQHQTLNNSFTANMPELYTEVVYSQSFDSGGRNARAGQSNRMFPTINPGTSGARPKNQEMYNADISMIDTTQLSNAHDVQRIVESHNATQVNKEVFVPSQINPRMKRKQGKSIAASAADKRHPALRGASAHSFGTVTGKSRANDRLRAYSIGQRQMQGAAMSQKQSFDGNANMVFSPRQAGTAQTRQQKLDETRNSYAKQMQNADDTQYQTAIMREARQQQMILEAARAGSQHSQQTDYPLMDASEFEKSFSASLSPFNLSPAASAAASELIQRFLQCPNEPISTDHFLSVQRKYELPPFEAYQLLLQQIQFQKALLTPPTAATVIKVSHNSYTSAVREKREEVINFRNDLFRRYTYMRKRSSNVTQQEMLQMGKTTLSKHSAGVQATSNEGSPGRKPRHSTRKK